MRSNSISILLRPIWGDWRRSRTPIPGYSAGRARRHSIPLAIKLSPYFSSAGHMALKLQDAGADALVLFNQFYQPDIDPVRLQVLNDLKLSDPSEIRLPLLWIAILAGQTKASLAASSGVAGTDEVVKYLLAGADVVMTTSALLRQGPAHIGTMLAGLQRGSTQGSSRLWSTSGVS